MRAVVAAVVAAVVGVPLFLVVVLGGEDTAPAAAAATLPGAGAGLKPGSVPKQYEALVLAAGSMCAAAPAPIIAAQIKQESGFNPNAVSPSGAQGISQFLPTTWPGYSKPGESPFDPKAAIPAQARYDCKIAKTIAAAQKRGEISKSLDLTRLMLAGYNAGTGAVLQFHGIPPYGETQQYVTAIMASAPSFANASAASGAGGSAPAGSFAAAEIAEAKKWLGTQYAWNGGGYLGPTRGDCVGGAAANDCNVTGFDCSGLVMRAVYVASHSKIRLDHFADTQTRGGTPVPRNRMQPGDIVSFTNPGESVAHHVGIYLGGNKMINAPESNAFVRIDSLTTPYYKSQSWRAVRYGV